MLIGIDIRNIGKKRTGDEVVFFNLTKNLAEIDSVNQYRLFTDIADDEILSDIKKRLGIKSKNNFKIISLRVAGMQPLKKFIWNFWTLPGYLCQNPVDIYLTQYITPFFVPKTIKIMTVIHDISFNFYAKYIKFFDLFFLKLLIPLSLGRADKIIAVSQFTRDEIIRYYKINPEKVEWIHNAVADNFSKEISREELESVRKKYSLPEKFILYVGTLQPRKNLATLIGAYAKIKSKFPDVKLVLAGNRGGHNFDKKINDAVSEAGLMEGMEIIFPGFVDEDDKPAIFRLAKVFCFPSFYEGFGIPILEAMASGTPAVISKIPPHQEIAEGAALFFEPDNMDELAEVLVRACRDEILREGLAQKGRVQAGKFSWLISAEKLREVFEKSEGSG